MTHIKIVEGNPLDQEPCYLITKESFDNLTYWIERCISNDDVPWQINRAWEQLGIVGETVELKVRDGERIKGKME